MRHTVLVSLLFLVCYAADAQRADDWSRLSQYAQAIGVDSLCDQPDLACVTRYFTQIVYGRTPRRMSYQGIPSTIDTLRINRLTHQLLAGADWHSLLDSLESSDPHYRQLTTYSMRYFVSDYRNDSLTMAQVQETLNTYRWLNRFPAGMRILVNIPSATLRVIDRQGNTLFSSRVVVGKSSMPTPLFTAYIPSIVLYP